MLFQAFRLLYERLTVRITVSRYVYEEFAIFCRVLEEKPRKNKYFDRRKQQLVQEYNVDLVAFFLHSEKRLNISNDFLMNPIELQRCSLLRN